MSSLSNFPVDQPAIADAQLDQLIRQRTTQLMATTTSTKTASLTVYLLHPSSQIPSAMQSGRKDAPAPKNTTSKDVTDRALGVVHTATHAASSLRAWASPRNYQYGWLAHAFSSGAGQPSGASVACQPVQAQDDLVQADFASLDEEAFERWTITFELKQSGGDAESMERELAGFVDQVLRFVGNNKAHLPGVTSAQLCPYPVQVVVRGAES